MLGEVSASDPTLHPMQVAREKPDNSSHPNRGHLQMHGDRRNLENCGGHQLPGT